MLRIKLEMIPDGIEEKKDTIGILEVAHIKSWLGGRADYAVQLDGKKIEIVRHYERSLGAWRLLQKALDFVPDEDHKPQNRFEKVDIDFIQGVEKMMEEKQKKANRSASTILDKRYGDSPERRERIDKIKRDLQK